MAATMQNAAALPRCLKILRELALNQSNLQPIFQVGLFNNKKLPSSLPCRASKRAGLNSRMPHEENMLTAYWNVTEPDVFQFICKMLITRNMASFEIFRFKNRRKSFHPDNSRSLLENTLIC
jgi:hypothetical protein